MTPLPDLNTYQDPEALTPPDDDCALPIDHDGPHVTRNGRGWHDSDDMDGGVAAALIEKEAERGTRGTATDSALARYWLKEYDRAEARAEKAEDRADDAHNLIVALRADLAATEARAEQAEKERDEVRGALRARLGVRAEPRPLTPRQNLAALWESAHRPVGGCIPAGTAIITRSDYGSGDVRYQTLEATGRDLPDPGYTLERNYNYGPENGEEYRLLDPPARPDWIDAPAVRAWHKSDLRTEHDGTPGRPRIWSPDYGTTDVWSTPSLPHVPWSDLVDVEPLHAPEDGAA